MSDVKPPDAIRVHIALGFEYKPENIAGDQAFGDCLFCGGKSKLYVSTKTGMWECKAGGCALGGNVYTYLKEWYKLYLGEKDLPIHKNYWGILSKDRGLPVEFLKRSGIVFNGSYWYIPVRNSTGSLTNLRRYSKGRSLIGLPGLDTGLFGIEELAKPSNHDKDVYLCEGEWDAMAMRHLLEREDKDALVVATPGSSVWKEPWTEHIVDRNVFVCYDNDLAGIKGCIKIQKKISTVTRSIQYINWPEGIDPGFDIRDLVVGEGTLEELHEILSKSCPKDPSKNEESKEIVKTSSAEEKILPISERPPFTEVMRIFNNSLHMTDNMEICTRIIFAVVLSNQIPGDPLWVHVVSPPGSAKTELLMPLANCASCHMASSLTSHSLVSGFMGQGGKDPSLLPKLNGKTLILKDFTEILDLPSAQRDEIYGTLRGAYDGSVQKQFGNGIIREYEVSFNMLSGVTQAIFGQRSASLGERFLMFHLQKGVGYESENAIRAAIENVGREKGIRHDLHDIVRKFVEIKVEIDDIPEMEDDMIVKIISLSQIVAMLRASVDRSSQPGGQEKLLYRPQHEMGTRLGKQFSKLLYGLGLVNSPPEITKSDYDIVSRVALDTCVGFNLEIVRYLMLHGGSHVDKICEGIDIPTSTVRDFLDDMCMLGAVRREKDRSELRKGAPKFLYYGSDLMIGYWRGAGLPIAKFDAQGMVREEEVVHTGTASTMKTGKNKG